MWYNLLFLFVILFIVIFLIIENATEVDTFVNKNPKILFLLRSYNRPEYLEKTLKSLDQSDVYKCYKRIIYDDCSEDKKTLEILNKYNTKYQIIYNDKNYKQKSMVKFLELIETNHKDYDLICYLDNDAEVKPNFMEILLNTYKIILKNEKLPVDKVLVTGFNCEKYHPVEKRYKYYLKKQSLGGINMVFHKCLIGKVKKWWDEDEDWEISRELKKEGGVLFSTNGSCIQHIGEIGHNSNKDRIYDQASDF